MAWTTPTTRATGDLITAAIWNTDLVDNLNYLKAEVDLRGKRLFSDGTEVLISNSTLETSLLTGTVPAGQLSATEFVVAQVWFQVSNTTGGSTGIQIRGKFGGTTICDTTSIVVFDTGMTHACLVEFIVRNDGATNAQEGMLRLTIVKSGSTTVAGLRASGTAAIDTTSGQTLAITAQLGSASASYTLKTYGASALGEY